jgi:HSP20 family protein
MLMSMERRRGSGYLPLRDAIDQLFEGSFIGPNVFAAQGGFPPADMHMTDDDVILDMSMPGVNPDDINISVSGDTVTISGEIHREQHHTKGQPLVEEIWRGRFQRSFRLPIQVDANNAEAGFQNGILRLTLPKSEATKPRKIQVRTQQPTIQGEGSSQSSSGQTATSQSGQSAGDTQTETVRVNPGQ